MIKVEKDNFIKQAETELQKRIVLTDKICDHIKSSYTGYSSIFLRFLLIFIFGLILYMLIWSFSNINIVFDIYPTNNQNRDSILFKAILGIYSTYILLRIYNDIVRFIMILNIDNKISEVKKIKKQIKDILDNIYNIANDSEKEIFGNSNVKFEKSEIDLNLNNFSKTNEKYSNINDKRIGLPLQILHWISVTLFAFAFLIISTPFVVEKLCEWSNLSSIYGIYAFLYIFTFLFFYMILQPFYPFNPGKIKKRSYYNSYFDIFGITLPEFFSEFMD